MVEEKVELSEQTPLKEAEQPAGEQEQSADAGKESAEKKEVEKKRWFFNKKAKKEDKPAGEAEAKPEAAKDADVEGGEPAAKKPRWWQRKPCCKKAEGEESGPSFGVDLVHRDDQQLHTAIDLGFGDIFGEPDAVHSLQGVWKATHSVFTAVRNFFYKLFTVLLCVPAAVVFGVLFALLSAVGVFVIVPAGRLLSVPAQWLVRLWSFLAAGIVGPICSAVGQIFGGVKVHKYGLNTDPTAVINA